MDSSDTYLFELIDEFFQLETTRTNLARIQNAEITGWEGWLQVEFGCFLSEHISEPQWDREKMFAFDKRKEKTRDGLKPDFLIRKKSAAKFRYIALEIKVKQEFSTCIDCMIKDMKKVSKVKQSELDIRSVCSLGIFTHSEIARKQIRDLSESLDYLACKPLTRIKGTDFSYFLLLG